MKAAFQTEVQAGASGLPSSVLVRRSDPVYNAHGYLTKVPVGAITPFIEAFTDPGDTVLDCFAGSGMTGVAALMTGRSATLVDISVLGRHIGRNYVNLVAASELLAAGDAACERALARLGTSPYETTCARCSHTAQLVRSVWSAVTRCRSCGAQEPYYRALERANWAKRAARCAKCSAPMVLRDSERVGEERVLDTIKCSCSDAQLHQVPADHPEVDPAALGLRYPMDAIGADREMFSRSALAKHGLTDVSTFFSRRNLAVLAALREAIAAEPHPRLREKLLFAFTAVLARASKRYQWSRARPLNAATQNYYVAAVYYEWNVFDLYHRKLVALTRSDEFIRDRVPRGRARGDIRYLLASADGLDDVIAPGSIDYVFTDPPFGSNIFYSDMNLFQEAWLGRLTDPSSEAVVHTVKSRRDGAADRYERLLAGAFSGCRRAVRPGGWISVAFSNSDGRMWSLLQRSLRTAGLVIDPEQIVVLDKGQRSVKGLASGTEDVVTCDLVLSAQSAGSVVAPQSQSPSEPLRRTLERLLESEDESVLTNPSRVYVAAIRHYLRRGWMLDELDFAHVSEALNLMGLERHPKTGLFATGP